MKRSHVFKLFFAQEMRCIMATANNPRFANSPNPGNGGRQSSEREGNQNAGTGVLESVKEGAENLASSVSTAAEQAWGATRQGAQQVAQAAETAFDSTNDFMRRYPLVTLGIGMCMGFSLCLALQGRRT
jgi:ElaB/YqjD/DUF883 family membrane-anchored ribosome-binding protein